jgi:hypothetical protein
MIRVSCNIVIVVLYSTCMKSIIICIISFLFVFNSFGQKDSLWKTKVINENLALKLPAKSQYQKSSFIQAFGGFIHGNYYALQYYDTIFLPINNQEDFEIALKGFVSGRFDDSTLKKYDAIVVDTTIGGAKGLFVSFTTNNTTENYKRIYYFVTLANNKFYWLYVYQSNQTETEMNCFFNSIQFDSGKLKEKLFRLTPVHLAIKGRQ